ncbi:Rare lipoprotein A-like double-psi beta-barrel protein [Ceratobasidium theobromae]|uniref:Rare lipoprotein A-like double-psi beta-barrel protein n=1 Tax=Ceratobasidium theobromae TaxID=1582974 RepID=A0A5N5QRK3_9AGAM|nr:Rare lipoprotein A-like double-psi beta-barrel protein [Ceratobasidium theobromae]
MSIGHAPNQQVHRRHANVVARDSVLQARGARKPYVPEMIERSEPAPRQVRKRGINKRRCALKSQSSSSEPSATPALAVAVDASTSSVAPTTTPEPEPTTTKSRAQTTSTKEKYTEPAETTTKTTKTSSSAAPTPTDDSNSGSSSGSTFTGEGTFYATGLGACGITNVDTDFICAVSQSLFDGFEGYTGSDPNSNPICNRKLKATYEGKTVTVTVTDRCVGCALHDIDFSPSAFDQLADQSIGRLKGLTWTWV